MALREALKLGDSFIGTAHLMLGLLEVEGCLGLQIVADVTDDVDEIKRVAAGEPRAAHRVARLWVRRRAWRSTPQSRSSGAGPAPDDVHLRPRAGVLVLRPRPLGGRRERGRPRRGHLLRLRRGGSERRSREAAAAGTPTPDPLPLPPRVFGDQPDGKAAEAVVAALRGAITADLPPEERIASMEDGATLVPLIEQAGQRFAGHGPTGDRGGAVPRPRTTRRSATRSSSSGGRASRSTATSCAGTGGWIVTRETIARMLRRAGVHPPPPPSPKSDSA